VTRASAAAPAPARSLDPLALREQFPILLPRPGRPPLSYLDNAATTQKPRAVIDRLVRYYEEENANVHRGLHRLAEAATAAYEESRAVLARFARAPGPESVVFTRNATEAVNLVARAWGGAHLRAGDEVVVTAMEHHSNLVPWQEACRAAGAVLRVAPIRDDGTLDDEAFGALLGPRTRLAAFTAKSNVLGTENPVARLAGMARSVGARVLVDAAQSAAVLGVDFEGWGADFVAFSAHKMGGPMGCGVLVMGEAARTETPPFLHGGEMVRRVTAESATWNDAPWRFEAGTPSVADAAGAAAAALWLEALGAGAVRAHEVLLTARAMELLGRIPGCRVLGPPDPAARPGVVAFAVDDVHPHDLAQVMDARGIAIRAGHHCAQPLHRRLGLAASARASFWVYNSTDEVEALAAAVEEARELFRGRR
jgi:cysteine desulfurase/selenocysteine lyase